MRFCYLIFFPGTVFSEAAHILTNQERTEKQKVLQRIDLELAFEGIP